MSLHIQLGLIALFGASVEVALKYKAMHEKAKVANVSLSLRNYLKQDSISIFISVVTIIMALMMLDNIANLHVNAMKWMKFIFAFVGYASANLILRFGSAANKKLNRIIDAATGYSENKTSIEEGSIKKNE